MEYITRGKPWQQHRDSITKETQTTKKYKERRKILLGFPIAPYKFTYDEILNYYANETIQCLLCGRQFLTLAKHLIYIHSTSIREYKDMYGLPNKRGLTGTYASANYKAATELRMLNKEHPMYAYLHDENVRESVRKKAVVAAQKQTTQPFRAELSRKHARIAQLRNEINKLKNE